MTLIGLAGRLNKTIAEIENISYNEVVEWVAFYEITDGARKT